jgi:hypothetical protein
VCFGVIGLHESGNGCVCCFVRPNGLLRCSSRFQATISARISSAIKLSKSSFPARYGDCDLDVAGKSGQCDFFHYCITIDGDFRAALRTELFPASLIHSLKSP